ncbi:MAG: GNAT family N-acetyltransferase [Acidobacteriota bacterium]
MSPQIRQARDLPEDRLAAFYRDMFPRRGLHEIWRWLYRTTTFESPLPLVMVDGDRIIGHAGGIPFMARLDGRDLRAQWFVDFALHPEYQRRGLGTALTEAWVQSADLCVTFCNNESLRVFTRLGWLVSDQPVLHTVWLKPGDHPRLQGVPGPARDILDTAAATVRGLARGREPAVEPRPLDASALAVLGAAMGGPEEPGIVTAGRDAEYVAWRIGESPNRARYRLCGPEAPMLVSVGDGQRLDVLWVPATHEPQVLARLSALARWAAAEGFSAVRYLPANPRAAASLRGLFPAVSRPKFAYWTADAALRGRLADSGWRWQLIDSDFEWI